MKYSVPGVVRQFSISNYQARCCLSREHSLFLNAILKINEYDLIAWLMGPADDC